MSLSCFLLSGYHAESSTLKHEHSYTFQALFQVHYIPRFYERFWAQKVNFIYEKIRILRYVSINTSNKQYFDHILPYFIYCCLANFQRIMNWYRLVLWFGCLFFIKFAFACFMVDSNMACFWHVHVTYSCMKDNIYYM